MDSRPQLTCKLQKSIAALFCHRDVAKMVPTPKGATYEKNPRFKFRCKMNLINADSKSIIFIYNLRQLTNKIMHKMHKRMSLYYGVLGAAAPVGFNTGAVRPGPASRGRIATEPFESSRGGGRSWGGKILGPPNPQWKHDSSATVEEFSWNNKSFWNVLDPSTFCSCPIEWRAFFRSEIDILSLSWYRESQCISVLRSGVMIQNYPHSPNRVNIPMIYTFDAVAGVLTGKKSSDLRQKRNSMGFFQWFFWSKKNVFLRDYYL